MDEQLANELERALKIHVKLYKHLTGHLKEGGADPKDKRQSQMLLKEIRRLSKLLE